MAKDKSINSKTTAAPAASSAGRGSGMPRGAATSHPPGQGGRGSGKTSTATSASVPVRLPPFPEGSRIISGNDGGSFVVDKDGAILDSLPAPAPATIPVIHLDAEGLRLPAGQVKSAKRLAARKAREEANPKFFSKGGTHELLSLVKNKERQETVHSAAPSASGAQAGQNNKRKRLPNTTTSGSTPPIKANKPNTAPQASANSGATLRLQNAMLRDRTSLERLGHRM